MGPIIPNLIQFIAGKKAKAAEVNSNFAAVKTAVNGFTSSAIDAAFHGDLEGYTGPMHSAKSDIISASAGLFYTSNNVDGALIQNAQIVGIGSANKPTKLVDVQVVQSNSSTISTVVSANVATSRIIVTYGAHMALDGHVQGGRLYVPLCLNGVPLATASSSVTALSNFTLINGAAAATVEVNPVRIVVINSTTVPTINFAIANSISLTYSKAWKTAALFNVTIFDNLWMKVEAQ